MLGLWALLTLTGALFSAWLGYGGRAFAATLTAFAFFLLLMLLFAARGMESSLASRFGAGSGFFLGAAVFLVYLIYGLGTNTFAFTRAAAIAGLVFVPLALAAFEKQKPPGAWEDFLILAGVWVAVKFSPSHWLWPYPGGRLAYVFTVLLCVNVALAAFVLLRRVNGIGYSIGWGRHWGFFILRVSSSSPASPFRWAGPCASSNLRRSGRSGRRSRFFRSAFSFSRPGPKNFSFAACCKTCFRALRIATSPAGGPLPFSLAFLTSPTWAFPTGAT